MAMKPAHSNPNAVSISGITYFHVLTFSSSSAFSIPTRVTTNSFNSSRVSASNVARDFSVCTVGPPDSQSDTDQEPGKPRRQRHLHRIFADGLVGAQARAVVSEFRLPSQVGGLLLHLAAKLHGLVAGKVHYILGVFDRGRAEMVNALTCLAGKIADALCDRVLQI